MRYINLHFTYLLTYSWETTVRRLRCCMPLYLRRRYACDIGLLVWRLLRRIFAGHFAPVVDGCSAQRSRRYIIRSCRRRSYAASACSAWTFCLYSTATTTRGWALDRVHNSRRPCGAVSLSGVTSQRHGAARLSRRDFFCTFWHCDLDLWPFDLALICWRDIVTVYPCAKFGDFSFNRFDFIVRTQTDGQNHRGGSTLYSRDYRLHTVTAVRLVHTACSHARTS